MKLRLGQPVHGTDGPFGDLADIVVDPRQQAVTHLVVEPHHRHQQARLIPIDLVSVDDDIVNISLDASQIRQQQRVSFSEFDKLSEPIDVGEDWDIGAQRVIVMPYWGSVLEPGARMNDRVNVRFDRIPKGECEIRRHSMVQTSDQHEVGHVEGLVADDTHLFGVVVRSGFPGLRHNIVVPMASVHRVTGDKIELAIDRDSFHRLPDDEGLTAPTGVPSRNHRFERRAGRGASQLQDLVETLPGMARRRLGHQPVDRSTDD